MRLRVRDLRLDDLAVVDDIGVDPGNQSGRINNTFLSVSFWNYGLNRDLNPPYYCMMF